MGFPKTPMEYARIAARLMLFFFLAPFVLAFLLFILYTFGLGFFPVSQIPPDTWVGFSLLGFAYILTFSPLLEAFSWTLLGWVLAMPGVIVANRGPRFASLNFAFAAFAASRGLAQDYWYVTAVGVGVLLWLAIAGWRLRNYVRKVQLDPRDAEAIHHQHRALDQREITTQEIISRR